ncbi:MAG: hypothetical protein MI867_21570 [Pseudomonadales bacterium]|nr:hypothetical protein [Pseudomonadales bacterium]
MRSILRSAFKRGLILFTALTGLLLAGCSNVVYKVTGDTMISFGEDKMIPYLLTTDDTRIGCVAGEALTPLMLSFGTVTEPPDDLAVLIHMVGGGCASQRATEIELDSARYTKERRVEEAQDARIRSKRWHGVAAQRYYKGYQALVRSMGDIGGECPQFPNEQAQLVWILGTAVSLQAVMADGMGGNTVGVPKDIAPKAERAATCLDTPRGNQRWWGLPKAIRAILWTVVPGLGPEGSDPWKEMDKAMKIGEHEGVRMSFALTALAAFNDSNIELTKDVIRQYAKSAERVAGSREYRLVDIMANDLIYAMSDKLWTDAVGHRTPVNKLGTFWDDKKEVIDVDVDIDDLF